VSANFVRTRFSLVTTACVVALFVVAQPAAAAGTLEIFPDPPVLVGLIVGFLILIFPLNAAIFQPLFRVMDEREARISGATEEAKQLVDRAEEVTANYREGIRSARDDAEGARREQLDAAHSEHASITGAARAESEDEVARARTEIEASLGEARVTLEAASRDLAKVAAERILGRPLA
jgi:F-type H+-transporting ATPase subunit b